MSLQKAEIKLSSMYVKLTICCVLIVKIKVSPIMKIGNNKKSEFLSRNYWAHILTKNTPKCIEFF